MPAGLQNASFFSICVPISCSVDWSQETMKPILIMKTELSWSLLLSREEFYWSVTLRQNLSCSCCGNCEILVTIVWGAPANRGYWNEHSESCKEMEKENTFSIREEKKHRCVKQKIAEKRRMLELKISQFFLFTNEKAKFSINNQAWCYKHTAGSDDVYWKSRRRV